MIFKDGIYAHDYDYSSQLIDQIKNVYIVLLTAVRLPSGRYFLSFSFIRILVSGNLS